MVDNKKNTKKTDSISLRDTLNLAKTQDTPILLALFRASNSEDVPKKKTKTKTKIPATSVHGLIEGEKCNMFNASGI